MNTLAEMEAFVTIVDAGGFTEAANKLRKSKSAISKHVSALEARLGVTLLHRTTRQVSPTDIGIDYYDKVSVILDNLRDANDMVRSLQSAPQGELTISVGTDLGNSIIVPMVSQFIKQYPDVKINLTLTNRVVNLAQENVDLAIRVGHLQDSSLMARKLATTKFSILGSPDYLKRNGTPANTEDLFDHSLLHYGIGNHSKMWTIIDEKSDERHIRGNGQLTINDGMALTRAATLGIGLSRLPCFLYSQAVKDGNLVPVLSNLPVNEVGVFAVYKQVQYTQPKLRAFIDFLTETFREKGNGVW